MMILSELNLLVIKLDDEEILFIRMNLPEALNDMATNSIGNPNLNLDTDNIKTLFWFEK